MYQSNFNSQAGDLVSGQVVRFGGPESGTLYNGTVAADPAPAGIWRQAGYQLPPFNKMCQDTYNANNKSGDKWDYLNAEQNSRAGMVATVCSQVRAAARAIYHAGANPSRADLLESFRGLGPIDVSNMDPAILTPDRPSGANIIYELKWNYPCPGSPTEPSCFQVQGQPSELPVDE
jgi:hypothetical protein